MSEMGDETRRTSAWASILTVSGLAVSLFGNILQYESLQQKKVELQQSQAKIDAANQGDQRRQDAMAKQLNAYQSRMDGINKELQEAADDNSRAQAGRAYGRLQDQQYANQMFRDSITRHDKLIQEQKELQEKIVALQLFFAR